MTSHTYQDRIAKMEGCDEPHTHQFIFTHRYTEYFSVGILISPDDLTKVQNFSQAAIVWLVPLVRAYLIWEIYDEINCIMPFSCTTLTCCKTVIPSNI